MVACLVNCEFTAKNNLVTIELASAGGLSW